MPTQTAPEASRRHDRRLAALNGITVAAVRRAWRKLDPRGALEDQYASEVGPQLTAVAMAAQVAAARESDNYIPRVLAELAFPPQEQLGVLVPQAMAGWAGDGRPVASLFASNIGGVRIRADELRGTPTPTKTPSAPEDPLARLFGGDEALARALAEYERAIDAQVLTLVADTARAYEDVAMAATPSVTHYVRMIEPGACSRCVLLAGRRYALNEGFERHPRCRCTHIPTTIASDQRTPVSDPMAYFDSLTASEQDRVFTAAGAQAIRDGADITKVVNARRGMERAQVLGRDVLITSEGTSRRSGIRLMPESILAIAGDDVTERVRLMQLHGFLA